MLFWFPWTPREHQTLKIRDQWKIPVDLHYLLWYESAINNAQFLTERGTKQAEQLWTELRCLLWGACLRICKRWCIACETYPKLVGKIKSVDLHLVKFCVCYTKSIYSLSTRAKKSEIHTKIPRVQHKTTNFMYHAQNKSDTQQTKQPIFFITSTKSIEYPEPSAQKGCASYAQRACSTFLCFLNQTFSTCFFIWSVLSFSGCGQSF